MPGPLGGAWEKKEATGEADNSTELAAPLRHTDPRSAVTSYCSSPAPGMAPAPHSGWHPVGIISDHNHHNITGLGPLVKRAPWAGRGLGSGLSGQEGDGGVGDDTPHPSGSPVRRLVRGAPKKGGAGHPGGRQQATRAPLACPRERTVLTSIRHRSPPSRRLRDGSARITAARRPFRVPGTRRQSFPEMGGEAERTVSNAYPQPYPKPVANRPR
jgi:hypothetical protein